MVFSAVDAVPLKFPNLPEGGILGKLLVPVDLETKSEPYLIEIPPFQTLSAHFFIHKGEEMGYLLSGELEVKLKGGVYSLHPGEVICLVSDIPQEWKNISPDTARLFWVKIK